MWIKPDKTNIAFNFEGQDNYSKPAKNAVGFNFTEGDMEYAVFTQVTADSATFADWEFKRIEVELEFNHTSGYTAPHYKLVVFGQTAPALFSVNQTTEGAEGSGLFDRWLLKISATQEITTATGTAYIEHIEPRVSTTQETTDATASGTFIMEVYCLSGAVQNENGMPMVRTVRAHRLSDGALAAETVTNSSGIFDINVGFESAEFYVIALDTGPEGSDYLPPVTNRVTSVLRYD